MERIGRFNYRAAKRSPVVNTLASIEVAEIMRDAARRWQLKAMRSSGGNGTILDSKIMEKTGVRKPKRGVISIFAGYSILLSNKLTSTAFQNHLELYDEFISWLTDLACVLLFNKGLKREDYTYAHLASAICSLALSVRHQVCTGHDVSAKILARSLAEYSDVTALLIVRPDLRTEFQKEENPEKFWRRHV